MGWYRVIVRFFIYFLSTMYCSCLSSLADITSSSSCSLVFLLSQGSFWGLVTVEQTHMSAFSPFLNYSLSL
ncbi:hypothetical protein BJ165DRAFT_1514942 [Panaeolus papilionaceus]|nr:hypothetical protein BJ165DRAFT_1514942 [Panaeolus papilionaceus]